MTRGKKAWVCEDCGARLPLPAHLPATSASLPGLERLPSIIAIPLYEFAAETHPVLQLHRLCDAAEILARFCAIVAIGEVRCLNGGGLPGDLLGRLKRIEMPTFGAWRDMLAALLDSLPVGSPLVVGELHDLARARLLPKLGTGRGARGETSLIVLRNDLVHGGGMTALAARRYLDGEPAEGVTGWRAWVEALVPRLDFLADCLLCHHTPERTLRLAGPRAEAGAVNVSADLRQALESRGLYGHVLLLHQDRWVDLWPLCGFGPARLTSLHGVQESSRPAPQVFVRAEETRLLYAALGVDLHLGERRDVVAEFRSLFRLDERTGRAGDEIPSDCDAGVRKDAELLVGREEELKAARGAIKACAGGVLWLTGPGGIGKSFLAARLARDLGNAAQRWCVIAWRFRASDGDRCHRHAFFRHAVRKLGAWPALGLGHGTPAAEAHKLHEQLAELLDRVADLKPDNPRNKPPRVLFVLDGLDEIARSDPDFAEVPFQLGRGNAVWLCVGRPEESLNRAFRPERCTHVFPDGLGRMSSDDVRAMLLEGSGERKYGLLKHDNEQNARVVNALVEAIVKRADGLPLYVRLVVEDINSRHLDYDPTSLARLPRGLAAYYDELLRRFGIGERQALLTPLVVSVCWAKAPLEEEALLELLRRRKVLLPGDPEQSREKLRQGLADLQVMLRPVALPNGACGYEPYHLTFRDHVRADEAKIIGDQGPLARAEFCELTCDWEQLPAGHAALRYVLRHGPEHLLEEKRHNDLFRLARDKDGFLTFQIAADRSDAEMALRTLKLAMEGASQCNAGTAVAEFMLAHARRLAETQLESPMEVLLTGELQRAVSVAKLYDLERSTLWLLLLAWELQERGRPRDAELVLGELERAEALPLTGWKAEYAALFLSRLAYKSPSYLETLSKRTLGGDDTRRSLVRAFIDVGNFASAFLIADTIRAPDLRVYALGWIASAQVKNGLFEAANETLRRAQDDAASLDRPTGWHAVVYVSEVQASLIKNSLAGVGVSGATYDRSGNVHNLPVEDQTVHQQDTNLINQAVRISTAISNINDRVIATSAIAGALLRTRQLAAARRFIFLTERIARRMDGWARDRILPEIAVAYAESGLTLEARRLTRLIERPERRAGAFASICLHRCGTGDGAPSFDEALDIANGISEKRRRVDALAAVAKAQALAKTEDAEATLTEAIAITDSIADAQQKEQAVKELSNACVSAQLWERARELIGTLGNSYEQRWPLVELASAQAGNNLWAEAEATAQMIEFVDGQVDALLCIARRQYDAGLSELAESTLARSAAKAASEERTEARIEILTKIATTQAAMGWRDAVALTLKQIRDEAGALDDRKYGDEFGHRAQYPPTCGSTLAPTIARGMATRPPSNRASSTHSVPSCGCSVRRRRGNLVPSNCSWCVRSSSGSPAPVRR